LRKTTGGSCPRPRKDIFFPGLARFTQMAMHIRESRIYVQPLRINRPVGSFTNVGGNLFYFFIPYPYIRTPARPDNGSVFNQ
jgi:hypothetical protein